MNQNNEVNLPQGKEPSEQDIQELRKINKNHTWYTAREELREHAYGGKSPNGYQSWGDYWKNC